MLTKQVQVSVLTGLSGIRVMDREQRQLSIAGTPWLCLLPTKCIFVWSQIYSVMHCHAGKVWFVFCWSLIMLLKGTPSKEVMGMLLVGMEFKKKGSRQVFSWFITTVKNMAVSAAVVCVMAAIVLWHEQDPHIYSKLYSASWAHLFLSFNGKEQAYTPWWAQIQSKKVLSAA